MVSVFLKWTIGCVGESEKSGGCFGLVKLRNRLIPSFETALKVCVRRGRLYDEDLTFIKAQVVVYRDPWWGNKTITTITMRY